MNRIIDEEGKIRTRGLKLIRFGTAKLYYDGKLVQTKKFFKPSDRNKLIDKWRKIYSSDIYSGSVYIDLTIEFKYFGNNKIYHTEMQQP